jgi:hypothetical protein
MTELDIIGIGVWSPNFSNWNEFSTGLLTGNWQTDARVQPTLMPSRERRRAPQSVKMAMEVMNQACEMAALNPAGIAAVFSSSMGDMQITDYLGRTLATSPLMVSPTKFHNSVHNASTGYWSIATQSHAPTTAISAHSYSAPMAFIEAAIQALECGDPILIVTQEMAAPIALRETCPSEQPFSAALLLAPAGYCESPVASICFKLARESVEWPELPKDLQESLSSNPGARLLPLLAAISTSESTQTQSFLSADRREVVALANFGFPLAPNLCLELSLLRGRTHEPG